MIQPSSPQKDPTGSRGTGEPVFLAVGKLARPHGLKGDLIMTVHTDFPEHLQKGLQVFLGEDYRAYQIEEIRKYKKGLLIRFTGVRDRQTAESLRGQWVTVREEDRPPLAPGEYYHHQLIGFQVITSDEEDLGRLEEILPTGANDVLVVRAENGRELLLPVIDEVVLNIDLLRREIVVHMLPGILSE